MYIFSKEFVKFELLVCGSDRHGNVFNVLVLVVGGTPVQIPTFLQMDSC